jgi:hypothetical protein
LRELKRKLPTSNPNIRELKRKLTNTSNPNKRGTVNPHFTLKFINTRMDRRTWYLAASSLSSLLKARKAVVHNRAARMA